MALRDILVQVDQADSSVDRLRLAASLAHQHGSHLTALYVRERNYAQIHRQSTAELGLASCAEIDYIREDVRHCLDQKQRCGRHEAERREDSLESDSA
jgi:hypothetical protein